PPFPYTTLFRSPQGLIDWGSGTWYQSGPTGELTTKSASFSGPAIATGSFTFLSPRRLLSLVADNGGASATTLVLSCPGQPDVQTVVAPQQVATIQTSWTGTCGSVTIGSSNGWETNFDDLVIDGGVPVATAT